MQTLVHGTPITPKHLLEQLAGESFCVSLADPRDLDRCIELQDPDGVLVLDNGAFTKWKKGDGNIDDAYRARFWNWANDAQARSPAAVAVIPDIIEGGTEADNWREGILAADGLAAYPERTMYIWHMDESLELLALAAREFNFLGIGSCAQYDIQQNRAGFLQRLYEASAVIARVEFETGRRPWIHVMRGLGRYHEFPYVDSADSTNVARNHTRYKGAESHVRHFADRIRQRVTCTDRQAWAFDFAPIRRVREFCGEAFTLSNEARRASLPA